MAQARRTLAPMFAASKWIANRMYSNNAAEATAIQMVDYVRQHSYPPSARSESEALRVLEQGLSTFPGEDISTVNAAGRLLLSMATILSDRGYFKEAEEKLSQVIKFSFSSLDLKVAALEALCGLQLRMHQDARASNCADECLRLLENAESEKEHSFAVLKMRAKAVKGLVELAFGNLNSAASHFTALNVSNLKANGAGLGASALAYAEFLHANGNLKLAKQMYELSLNISEADKRNGGMLLAACAMVPEEVHLGAECGLGQLATHCRQFDEAEQMLTAVLKEAEKNWGENSQKVAIVLGCIAEMYGYKGGSEGRSYFLVQEGLYRRALEILKSSNCTEKEIDSKDVIALLKGGYSQVLSQQLSRAGEAEKMREWATSMWQNRRVSVANVLEKLQPLAREAQEVPDNIIVTDIRLGRVL